MADLKKNLTKLLVKSIPIWGGKEVDHIRVVDINMSVPELALIINKHFLVFIGEGNIIDGKNYGYLIAKEKGTRVIIEFFVKLIYQNCYHHGRRSTNQAKINPFCS